MQIKNLTIAAVAGAFMAISVAAPQAANKKSGSKDGAPPPAKIEDIHVVGAWTRAARKGDRTHLFLTVENKGGVPVQLRGGETEVAAAAQLVRFRMQGPYLRTWLVDPVVIGPHERYAFEQGVVALELRKLHKELRRGDVIPVTLEFSGIGVIKVDAEVDSRTAIRYPPPLPMATGGAKAH